MNAAASFSERLLDWFDRHGRHDLPWQHPREPYRVWLSEIMLQQTQVATVIPYFQRFVQRFPDLHSLAEAPQDDVLALWAGLGYYARARNLQRCAQALVTAGGHWPRELDALSALPGIGRSTAAAILAQAFGLRHAILDGNVRRLLARHAGVAGWPGLPAVQKKLWAQAEARLPTRRLADYTQALMDLGAGPCNARRPDCAHCPVSADCAALQQDRVKELPAPRPRRARPRRSQALLLIYREDGALLMERRPPSGLWGALWCPPLADPDHTPEALSARLGIALIPDGRLPAIQHAFTHFDLELQPLCFAIGSGQALHEDGAQRWFSMACDAPLPGMPAPVARLLARLSAPQSDLLPAARL